MYRPNARTEDSRVERRGMIRWAWTVVGALVVGSLVGLGCSFENDNSRMPPRPDRRSAAGGAGPNGDAGGSGGGRGSTGEYDPPPGCNPLASRWDCLLPYPSDFFLTQSDEGPRVTLTDVARPKGKNGGTVDFLREYPADGFSMLAQILVLIPEPIDERGLPFHGQPVEASTGADAPVIIIAAESAERIAHFTEGDPTAPDDASRVLFIRPLAPLAPKTRYIVALRDLRSPDGALIAPPEGFRRLRDGEGTTHPALAPLVDPYEQGIFPVLAAAGVPRDGLLLAWDFTTGSQESVTRDMLAVRAQTMAACEAEAPRVTVSHVEHDVDERIARRIQGTLKVPHFLDRADVSARLRRGADGQVTAQGFIEADFLALVPRSVADAPAGSQAARLVQYGHGFFATREEMDKAFPRRFADETASVLVGVDWLGMSTPDASQVVLDIANTPDASFRFTDRVHQAMADQIALSYAVKSTLLEIEPLRRGDRALYDPDRAYLYGLSQGHILGGTFLALSPHFDRAILDSGGAGFSLMMSRARPFATFWVIIKSVTETHLDATKYVALSQSVIDRIDPGIYAKWVLDDPLPGGPTERVVLMRAGYGDTQVPVLATHVHARALGARLLSPASRSVPGLDSVEGPIRDGATYVEHDFHLPEPVPGTFAQPPARPNEVHTEVRALDVSVRAADAFLQPDGVVQSHCDGLCDPD